ncbi:hypothetical protein WICPIJ_005084 [Wickerhamomyces pijperi]|uniref:Uncharacterized protein n=1 Tax=Wickerhamomyces pijperi TaxID=599730 RepID=A0A9P8Q4K9_WICPI|nr:hypothetical protein WICPIJ_005084 [Wickerhamomyces pijperi]
MDEWDTGRVKVFDLVQGELSLVSIAFEKVEEGLRTRFVREQVNLLVKNVLRGIEDFLCASEAPGHLQFVKNLGEISESHWILALLVEKLVDRLVEIARDNDMRVFRRHRANNVIDPVIHVLHLVHNHSFVVDVT